MPTWLDFVVILAVLGGSGGILGRLGRVLAPLGGVLEAILGPSRGGPPDLEGINGRQAVLAPSFLAHSRAQIEQKRRRVAPKSSFRKAAFPDPPLIAPQEE